MAIKMEEERAEREKRKAEPLPEMKKIENPIFRHFRKSLEYY
jgi:hypothetical protein